MKRINYTHSGGFPLEQHVLDKMQMAYYETLKAFLGYLKIADVGNYILSGCEINGADITPGMMYIDGDLCAFDGAEGTPATKIKKVTLTENAAFENGLSIAVFSDTFAQINADGTALLEFTRFYPVYDQNYVHTDFNFTQILKDKLDGIEPEAEVNVFSNWNAIFGTPGFILNKPNLPKVLRNTYYDIGDFGNVGQEYDELITINFPTLGTANYIIVAELVSMGSWTDDNDVNFVLKNHAHDGFQIALQEINYGIPAHVQNLRLHYMIIEQPI